MASFLMRRTRMSPVDTAWLRMDSPGNLMMIVGVDVFEGAVDADRLRRVLETKLLAYDRFRCRAIVDATGAWWEECDHFDINQHLIRIGLPGQGSKEDLQNLVAQLASQSLDHARPLWQMHLVENYHGGAALIVRIHHCIADGIALNGVLLSLASTDANASDEPAARRAKEGSRGPLDALLRPFTAATVKALGAGGEFAARAISASRAMLVDPKIASDAAADAVRMAARVTKDAAALALMASDTATSLKGKPCGSKSVAWCEPLPLANVKAVGRAIGCSVNDVLLACAAGAMREYLASRGDRLDGAELRAMVPVNLRGSNTANSLGNKFGLVPLLLPIGIEHPLERVLEVQRRMNDLKGGTMPILAMAVLGLVGAAPRFVQQQALDMLASKATAVMTNVPGPQQALYMAGAKIKQMMFWVPQSGDISVGVSILSYDGGVQFGVVTDRSVCAEPQKIIDRFAPEFEKLVYALLLAPWDETVDSSVATKALAATEAVADVASHLGDRAQASGNGAGRDAASATAPKPPGMRTRKSAFATARANAGR